MCAKPNGVPGNPIAMVLSAVGGLLGIALGVAGAFGLAHAINVPFIVPVSVDATMERGALVPDAFLAVQWTRLPAAEGPEKFCARVQTLLGSSAVLQPALEKSCVPVRAKAPHYFSNPCRTCQWRVSPGARRRLR